MSQSAIASDELAPDPRVETLEKDLRHQVLRSPGVRALVGSRFAASLAVATLAYGAMVYLATIGASQVAISLIGATRFLAALLFGIGGGALVDAMSKRSAMVTSYALEAAVCLIIPTVWGTNIPSLVLLIFIVSTLGQVAIPAVKAATALVSSSEKVAVVAAVISVAGGIGAALGSAFLAPLLINVANLQTIIYATGIIMALATVWAWRLPREEASRPLFLAVQMVDWKMAVPTLRRTSEWLLANRKVGALLLVGGMVMALFEGMNTLMPVFVRDVLGADPTNTVYILAPGGIGFLAGTVLGPWLMDRHGERALAVIALVILSLGFVLFGFINVVAPVLAPFSPLRLLGLFGFQLTPQIQAAGLISIFTALGSTSALAAVQTYVNRYVLLAHQATTFGMQEVLDNALILFGVLAFGGIATTLGSRVVFIVAPVLIVTVVVWMIGVCFRVTDRDPPEARRILHALLDTSRGELAHGTTEDRPR